MISSPAIASRVFTLQDQREFARFSGDFNPLHLDAQFARRTQMGAPVVHGIHTVLWALDSLLRTTRFDLTNIRVRFHQPLFLDETASVQIGTRDEAAIDLDVVVAGAVVASIRLSSRSEKPAGGVAADPLAGPRKFEHPADIPFEQIAGQRGKVAAAASDDEIGRAFPALAKAVGAGTVAGLMATSQIVGMACPGLHSLFSGLDVALGKAAGGARTLDYAVSKADARFRSVQIGIVGAGLAGRIDAFARQRPTVQADMGAVAARLAGAPFSRQRALVIGGSRGLGEVTAKIVAAGGGHPIISYREGRQAAEQVAAEMRRAGATCEVLRFDALEPADQQLAAIGHIDSCYYFATPKIFQRKSALFEPKKLAGFLDYYVNGFDSLCMALVQRSASTVAIFYPSTTALDAPVAGTAEYAVAKAAGETLAHHLNAFQPGLKVISRRLPRIATDQTATVGVASSQDALDVLLPIVHEVQQAARSVTPVGRERS